MNSISKITDMLLKKYNEKYEAFEKNNVDDKIDNINPRDILDFKKIILDLKDTNKTAKTLRNEDIKEIDCHDTKITNLTEMDFVQDLTLTEKIVIFRKLEIKKQIMIINYLIQSFKVVSYQLIKYEEKNSARLGEEQIRREHDILIKNKNNIKSILNSILENGEVLFFLRKTLCRYISLEENLVLLLKKNRA
jgi:hypothetical protein